MAAYFRCSACDRVHPSRLRAANREQLFVLVHMLGEILEPCPVTGLWVRTPLTVLQWSDPVSSGLPLPAGGRGEPPRHPLH